MARDEAFDVFLSYSRADASNAQRLVQLLRSRGLKVFFDRDYLTPGQAWPTLLEKHLRACRAVAICLGPEGLGPWQQREQYVALDRQVQEDHFPVIPLLLPGAKDPPLGFLRLSTWIDLKAGVEDWPALNVLERAIRGQAPSPDDAGLPDARATVCPYRGLEPFREEDEHFFVGREAFVRTLLEKIGQRPLVGVVGASGSGKSSVVLAGLVPSLRQRADGRVWEIGVMRPGPHPLRQLAAVFLPPDTNLEEFDRIAVLKKRAEQLASGEITLADVIDTTLERQPGTDRLLLVVDQWEELYTRHGICRSKAVKTQRTSWVTHRQKMEGSAPNAIPSCAYCSKACVANHDSRWFSRSAATFMDGRCRTERSVTNCKTRSSTLARWLAAN